MDNEVMQTVRHVLLLVLIVFGIGIISGRVAKWLRLPDVVLFIGAGMLLGQGMHLIAEQSSSLTNQLILAVGSALILFDGGRNIRWHGLKKVAVSVTLLSTVGVVITAGLCGYVAHEAFGLDWMTSLLIGAVISSTDPATIIPVFRQVKVRERLRETVESESAFNDATGSILTFALLAAIVGGQSLNIGEISYDFLRTALGGIAVGLVISFIVVFLVAHASWGWFREYAAISMISVSLAAYLAGDMLHVSGLMATFTAGLVWGNAHLLGLSVPDKQKEMGHVADNASVMMRMFIFILLGSQVDFSLLGEYLWPSLAVVAILVFIARPLTVFASVLPDLRSRWTWKEMLFMCWVRETGVIPAALSGIIVASGIPYADRIAAVVLMAVVFTILVQASTSAWLARKLGLEEKDSTPIE
ncbi:cation:proton antiporter [Cohnella lupini]|uniref:NhaP-type Na+/H+ or K+/H+ antiporter n=1 Tax=Cohnella lupini TaxID=1294267 RepID=A0A3D9I5V4_9BACL|nr:cation:proton antiporter [Cohnella lupini]RED57132.1 NhaP-type Na+/H+ or K+/H+ antiporter [Cohnella lupini]